MKKILPFFSYCFHPIFIPLLGSFLYTRFVDLFFTEFQYLLLFLHITLITVIFPIILLLLFKKIGKVDNLMFSITSQRKIPLLVQLFLLGILIQKSITVNYFPPLYYFLLGGMLSIFFAFCILFVNHKTSIHMIGISSLTVFIIGLSIHTQTNSYPLVSLFILLNGLIASSRLSMNAHTFKELWIGFLCGVLPQSVLLFFWL